MSETAQGGVIVICGLIVFIYGILRWVIWGKSRAQRFIEKAHILLCITILRIQRKQCMQEKEADQNRLRMVADLPYWQHFALCSWLPDYWHICFIIYVYIA